MSKHAGPSQRAARAKSKADAEATQAYIDDVNSGKEVPGPDLIEQIVLRLSALDAQQQSLAKRYDEMDAASDRFARDVVARFQEVQDKFDRVDARLDWIHPQDSPSLRDLKTGFDYHESRISRIEDQITANIETKMQPPVESGPGLGGVLIGVLIALVAAIVAGGICYALYRMV